MPLAKHVRPPGLIAALLVSACLALPAAAQEGGPSSKVEPVAPGPVAKPATPDSTGAKPSDQAKSDGSGKAGDQAKAGDRSGVGQAGDGEQSKSSDEAKRGQDNEQKGKTSSSGSESNAKSASSERPSDPRMADAQAFFDARLAALHAGLSLSADQEPLWSPIESAIRDLHKSRRLRDREQLMDILKESPSDLLRMRSEQLVRRGNAMKQLVDATGPLLEKLDDMQKRRLPMLIVGMRPARILRAAFDIRYGHVMSDPDDEASPRGSQRHDMDGPDEADEDGGGGMGRHHRHMHDQDYGRGGDKREGASYDDGRGDSQAMRANHAGPSDD